MQVFWLEAQPWDHSTGAAVTVRACSTDISALVLINGAPEFYPVLDGGPTFSTSAFDGAFTGRVAASSGSVGFAAGLGDIDYWAKLGWTGRPVKIWTADVAAGAWPAWAALTKIFDGVAVDFKPGLRTATLNIEVTTPIGRVASATYAGTGNQEGRVELTGVVKPYALGTLLNRPAKLLDSAKGLYQLHGYSAIDSVAKYREGYRELNQTRVAEASRAALIAATVPATEIHTYLAEGLFRVGFQPVADITCDFNGSNTGGFSARPGALVNRMLLDSGWAGAIDTASTTALDAALPHDAWIYDDEGRDIADMLDEFMSRVGGYWDVTKLGTFYVGLVKRQAAVATIGMSGSLKDYDLLDIDALATRPPFHKNRVGYGFNPRTFTAAELAFAAGERGDYAAGTNYTLDNIVTNQGARWQYISATVAAGNAPPTLPTTSNAYWSLLTYPPDFADIVGTTKPADNATKTSASLGPPDFSTEGAEWIDTSDSNKRYLLSADLTIGGVSPTYGGVMPLYWLPVSHGDFTVDQPSVSRLSPLTGQALPNFTTTAGGVLRSTVASGEARDGDVIWFGRTLSAVPRVFFGSGGIAPTAGQNVVISPEGLSTSGFVMRAVSQTFSGAATVTDTGAAAGGTGEPDFVMDRSGSVEPSDGRYTFTYRVAVANIGGTEPENGYVEIGLFVRQSGEWNQCGTAVHTASGSYRSTVTPGPVDHGSGAEFGVSLIDFAVSGSKLTSLTSVEYVTATVVETSLTPTGASPIPWSAEL